MADPKSYRPSSIPTDPGVYRFFDENDKVIYVGKAKNLKNRLNSYFGSNLAAKTHRMVHTAVRVDWTIVASEVDALRLEYTWIKSFDPQFNIQFKDDKSYPYLAISLNEDFPKMYISRQRKIKGVKYFGPFAHTWALRTTFDLLLKMYPVRTCSSGNFERAVKSKRQCLLGDIGKCAAPCVGWISQEDHRAMALRLAEFFESDDVNVFTRIEQEMHLAAENEDFERAASLRDQLVALKKAGETTEVSMSENFSADVIAIHEEITHAAASLFCIRSGRIISSRSWIIDLADVLEDDELIAATLAKVYQDALPPQEVLINKVLSDTTDMESWLSELANRKVKISTPVRGEKFDVMQTVKRNAFQALIQYLSKRSNDAAVSGKALEEIADALELPELPLRIECFDISNIQGNHMVASMVVFEDGQIKKSDYRRFAISDDENFDDTRAMHHVITRRLKRYLAEKEVDLDELRIEGGSRPRFAYPPQLIVVDGGAPQVAAAARALAELGISDIALCGLAKRLEEVWLPDNPNPVIFPRHSEGLYLLQRIRDEAHRFAITFHRSKRSKVMLESLFDEIPQLGEVRRKALIEAFGSIAALKKASLKDVAQVPGIGEKIALLIVEHLADSAPSVDISTGEILD
jgi:excinuclease ABC subunit C